MRTDGQAGTAKLMVAFRKIANAPKTDTIISKAHQSVGSEAFTASECNKFS